MKSIVVLEEPTQNALQGMANYWNEIAKRDNYTDAAAHEVNAMLSTFFGDPLPVLLIVGEYARSFISEEKLKLAVTKYIGDHFKHWSEKHTPFITNLKDSISNGAPFKEIMRFAGDECKMRPAESIAALGYDLFIFIYEYNQRYGR